MASRLAKASRVRSRDTSTLRFASASTPRVLLPRLRRVKQAPPLGNTSFFGAPIYTLLQSATTHPDLLDALRRLWEYILLATTVIVTEEASPLIGGLRAHTGHLRLIPAAIWVSAGTTTYHILLYYLG